MITKEIMATMLANHKAWGVGDTVELTYEPFRGDIFGSTKGIGKASSYAYTEIGDHYRVASYNAATGIYTLDYDEMSWTIPFYCLKLVKKSDGRDLMIGSYDSRISADGKTIDVGCQNIKFDSVKAAYEAMLKVQSIYKPKPKKVVAKATTKVAAKKKAR